VIVQSLWRGLMCVVDGHHVATVGPNIRTAKPSAKFIIHQVAAQHGLQPDDLTGQARFGPLVKARQEAMYRLSKETRLSSSQIGKALGGRDHTTVLYGIARHAERIAA